MARPNTWDFESVKNVSGIDYPEHTTDVTSLLRAWSAGDKAAEAEVLPLIYDELHRIARSGLNGDAGSITLQATDIVSEAYLRLSNQRNTDWKDRQHFFAITATVVRRVLLDAARKRLADKRDKRKEVISLDADPTSTLPVQAMTPARAVELIDLDNALLSLTDVYPRQARLVELRYFSGLSIEDSANYLGVSLATAKRDWCLAKAWLHRRLTTPA
ncbi:MAG: sigma-70 family RNA polymerase sigma factor [Pseudomonadota bacterium]